MPRLIRPRGIARAVRQIGRGELVRITLQVTPASLIRGANAGRFPFPRSEDALLVPWFCPSERAVLRAETVHLGQTLRKRLRNKGWLTSVDEAFEEVVRRCADRPDTWITTAMRDSFNQLHQLGRAHSLEVWSADGRLIAGTFGVQTGGLISAESLFHSEDHASKVALVDLASRVRAGGGVGIDCQFLTPHTKALGALVMSRKAFRRLLYESRDLSTRLSTTRLAAARLADLTSPDAVDVNPR